MPIFKSKKPKLTPEEKLAQARAKNDTDLANRRAKFDAKNIDYQRLSETKLNEIRANTDARIEQSRIDIAENIDIENAWRIEQSTVFKIISDEDIAVITAKNEENSARITAKNEENSARSHLKLITRASARAVTLSSLAHDIALIHSHNRGTFKEVGADMIAIKNDFIDANRRISAENRLRGSSMAMEAAELHEFDEFDTDLLQEELDLLENEAYDENQGIPEFPYPLSDHSFITPNNFDKIQEGMTLDEVVAILGPDGYQFTQDEVLALFDSDRKTINALSQASKKAYKRDLDVHVWAASFPSYKTHQKEKVKGLINAASISVVFRDGIVVGKGDSGVKRNQSNLPL